MSALEDARVPDVLGEVIAWRAWRVIGGGEKLPLLASATHSGTHWHPNRWTLATCGHDLRCSRSLDGRPPGEDCSCGLYAAQDRAQLMHLGYGAESYVGRTRIEKPKFIGEVALAGKVIEGSQGWRAEKGRIVRLYVPFHHWRFVEGLERMYRGVDVVLDNTQR